MRFPRQIEALFESGTAGGQSDGELLERFVQQRDEAAFAALVDRHGAMVLRVCRQVLLDEHDAQDASQATFLVLARRASLIRGRESAACWLHGVALRVAAKARVAAARRRARERRAGEMMAARHAIEMDQEFETDHERWRWLHDELGRLSESFRSPLVLCYLEGLTQEQAAIQLRCPLGTVQSRLARGRAKLRARLKKREMDLPAAFAETGLCTQPAATTADSWAERTVRLAIRFTHGSPVEIAHGTPAITLADEVFRTMTFAKLKLAVGLVLVAAFMATGAAMWASREGRPGRLAVALSAPIPNGKGQPTPPQPGPVKGPEQDRKVTRVLRGIVRDDQGRPLAKAWVGSEIEPMLDVWRLAASEDRIRVTQKPYRDSQGQVIPAGPLGSYYEYRDDEGHWQPLDPSDVRRVDPSHSRPYMSRKDSEAVKKEPGKTFLEVRMAKGRRRIIALDRSTQATAARTDAQGSFAVEATFALPQYPVVYLHFASPDFRQEQAAFVGVNDPDRLIDITLKPTSLVRAKLIETPTDRLPSRLEWNVYAVLTTPEKAGAGNATDGWGAWWGRTPYFSTQSGDTRLLELNLAPGRYKVLFKSPTIERTVDLAVPAGVGPVDLPDIRVESLAWFKMLGGPATEIEAVDRDGKPVKLADYRGRIVLLAFLDASSGASKELPQQLIDLMKPLQDQPLTVLAIHDASITSLDDFRNKQAPIFDRKYAPLKIPLRLLLDRPPAGEGAGENGLRAGEIGSGRTSARYELVEPACFVIDKNGLLVFALMEGEQTAQSFRIASPDNRDVPPGGLVENSSEARAGEGDDEKQLNDFAAGEIDRALREQLGLPHASDPDPLDIKPFEDYFWKPKIPREGLVIRGKVLGPDGKGVAGALVTPILNQIREKEVKTLPSGAFSFTIDEAHSDLGLKVEAPGLASKTFWMWFYRKGRDQEKAGEPPLFVEPDGRISKPLQIGPGAEVAGRVVRDGKPVAGVTIVVQHPATVVVRPGASTPVRPLEDRQAKTDERGYFRIPFVSSELECSIFAPPGSLADHQTIIPRTFQSGRDGTVINLGDFAVRPGRRLAGRIVMADGKAPPHKAKLVVWPQHAGELTSDLDSNGRFEVNGVPDGGVCVYLTLKMGIGIVSDLPGYRLSARNKCLDPTFPDRLQGTIKEDITNLTIQLDPGEAPEAAALIPFGIDPTRVADFEEAKTGPITGVAPRP